jgi:uracil-DNA glycosylase family protein
MPWGMPTSMAELERSAADFFPKRTTLRTLAAAAADCRGCDLYRNATQTVFGEGPRDADVMLVGEQPGDREDVAGRPFVGPAGALLDRALEQAGIDRDEVYMTNVVKHFKWKAAPGGKRRIHRKPDLHEVLACKPWLEAEIGQLHPSVLVLLGATAAQAIFGSAFRVTKERGTFLDSPLAPAVTATVHPSSILRARDQDRDLEMKAFVADLTVAAHELGSIRTATI